MAKSTPKIRPFCVLFDDGDVEWLKPVEANKVVRFHTQTGLLQEVNNNVDLLDLLGLTLAADVGAVRSAHCYVRKEIHPDIFWHSAAATALQKLGEAWDKWQASRSPPLLGHRPVLIGHSAVGDLTVPIALVFALALEIPVRDSVTPATCPMPGTSGRHGTSGRCHGVPHRDLQR